MQRRHDTAILASPECDPLPEHLRQFDRLARPPAQRPCTYLRLDSSGLFLVTMEEADREHLLQIDFTAGALDRRRRSRDELLFRAVGGVRRGLRVTDATAGLGTDAFLLASAGCVVRAFERNPVVFALLLDARKRALRYPELRELFDQRLTFIHADARHALRTEPPPDVVLIDPMFPQDNRSALNRQQMRSIRNVVGDDADATDLLHAAMESDARRVVVKRMHDAPRIEGPAPSFVIQDRTTRFDCYVRSAIPSPGRASPLS